MKIVLYDFIQYNFCALPVLVREMSSYCAFTVPIRMCFFLAGQKAYAAFLHLRRSLNTQCTIQLACFNQDFS